MNTLEECREEITRIDTAMAALFCERMRQAEKIAAFKRENGLPILDEKREKTVLENGKNRVPDTDLQPYYLRFLQTMMDISKDFQAKTIEKED